MLVPTVSNAETFNILLKIGMRNNEVVALQTLLAQDSTIYPQGLVTGYFGPLTKSAVIKFQLQNNLVADGIVGPKTRAVLNSRTTLAVNAPMISNAYVSPARNSAIVSWGTNIPAKGVVYYSTSPLSTYEHENSVDVSGVTAMTDSSAKNSQSVLLNNLLPNTTYYYLIYSTAENGAVSVTWPSTFSTTN
jgi:peptidoglycan hydrolase-like protein with peptidoglycan-binding domain